MRPWLAFVFMATLAVGLAALVARAPEALAKMEAFRVTRVTLEGNRFLTQAQAESTLDLSATASVWDDLDLLEERLGSHPLVEEAKVGRRFPGTLTLKVVERIPVALAPNPTLEPVDASGRFLPIDPAVHRLDLPLITVGGRDRLETLSASERNLVAGEIARMAQRDPEFLARISEVILDPRGDLRAEVYDPPMTMLFRPNLPSRRIQEGMRVFGDALTRFEGAGIADLDLRYEDQVVVRLSRIEGN
jgi:cell division septal protein FtsQ